uniref:Uncharacterized protein n=1 Tax=Balamuthia mandrillaris TaxID=66527 RepID=A0A0K1HSK4_9EUKA|nr:hypothetical protein [Balamuthia mandrillaris]AKT94897.1 hypothetical protein [Balamuthia mandrillaris]
MISYTPRIVLVEFKLPLRQLADANRSFIEESVLGSMCFCTAARLARVTSRFLVFHFLYTCPESGYIPVMDLLGSDLLSTNFYASSSEYPGFIRVALPATRGVFLKLYIW